MRKEHRRSSMLTERVGTLSKAQLPFILAACKCDQHPAHREVDPTVVEQKAKSFIGDVSVFQTSESSPETYRGCLSVITRAAIAARRRKFLIYFCNKASEMSRVSCPPKSLFPFSRVQVIDIPQLGHKRQWRGGGPTLPR
jgi:hypothetical protein